MLNYRHLYYFSVVAKEGGFARAAERLDMAIQTISAQVRELERALGHQLLRPAGRGVALTEAGQAALARAEEIFSIGARIPDEVRAAAVEPAVRLKVGLSDGLSKLAAHALLQPVLDAPTLRLTSVRLVESPVDWYGPAALVHKAQVDRFPASLAELPLLLPTGHSALRHRIDRWLDGLGIAPRVVGEFEDSALLTLFAAQGMGVCPVCRLGAPDVGVLRGMKRLGASDDLREEVHAIRSRRGLHHPLVQRVLAAADRAGGARAA